MAFTMKQIRFLIEYAFLRFIVLFFSLFPYEKGKELCGRAIGAIGWNLAKTHRERVLKNLSIAFPENSLEKNTEIALACFRNAGHQAIEFIQLDHMDEKWMDKYFEWESEGLAAVMKAKAAGKGIMFIVAHFGNWEMLNHSLHIKTGLHINLLVAPLANPYANEYVCNIRKRLGTTLIYPDDAGADILKALKRGECAAFTSDQNAGRRGLFIPFFNQPASTHRGAAIYSYLSGAENFFIFAIRLPYGRFRVEIIPMGVLDRSRFASKDESILDFTLQWVDVLEKYVRKYPDQYFWLHNRWKTKPLPEDIIQKRIETKYHPYG